MLSFWLSFFFTFAHLKVTHKELQHPANTPCIFLKNGFEHDFKEQEDNNKTCGLGCTR